MIVKIKKNAERANVEELLQHLENKGFDIHSSFGSSVEIYGVVGDTASFDIRSLYAYKCVDSVIRIQEPYKKVNRKIKSEDTVIKIKDVEIGGGELVIMAGPCSVESYEQVEIIAKEVKKAGAKILRGGAFKPRTSPYSYQGMGIEGLKILREVADKNDLLVVSELRDKDPIPMFDK